MKFISRRDRLSHTMGGVADITRRALVIAPIESVGPLADMVPAPASAAARRVVTTSHSWTEWSSLAPVWSSLHAAQPHASSFLAAEWVSAWLAEFGAQFSPELVVFYDSGDRASGFRAAIGCCVLVKRIHRRGPFRIRRIYLHTAGEDEADECVVENNTILCSTGRERDIAIALRSHVDREPWDEFVAPALSEGPIRGALLNAFGDVAVLTSESPNHYVNLSALSETPDAFLATLSRRGRKQVRWSLKKYGAYGEIVIDEPHSTEEAQEMLEELAALHQRAWRARGRAGAFSSKRFFAFHRAFINGAFESGRIQLLRVRAGNHVIGLLYNLVSGGTVSSYQSGLSFGTDKRLKPGFVAHTMAIQHCRAAGFSDYEFLAGNDLYKQSLSTDTRTLLWMALRNNTFRMRLFRGLHRLRNVFPL